MRRFWPIYSILAVLIAIAVVTGDRTSLMLADRDCVDFPTQQAAQRFFKSAGTGDPHGLDRDGDGIVCEWNPR